MLCSELLNPTFRFTNVKVHGITRSAVIQKLTLLVGFLDWVHPAAPNASLCCNCNNIIKRVLDHILNGHVGESNPAESFGWEDYMPLEFSFDLLDTLNWVGEMSEPTSG